MSKGLFGQIVEPLIKKVPARPAPPAPRVERRVVPRPPLPKSPHPATPAHAQYVYTMLLEYFDGNAREAIRFMRAHASVTILVPQASVIEKLVLEKQIVEALDRDPSAATVTRLHLLHSTPKRGISKVYKRVRGTGVAQRRKDQMHCRTIRLSRLLRRVRV